MNSYNLYEAYAAVYNEDLREDLAIIEEDLSFVDDLSDNELVQIMEEILSEEEVTLQECIDIFDFELLSESDYMQSMMRAQNKKRAAERSAAATAKREKSAERERVGRKHAMKRLQVAATRAGRNLADKAKAAGQKAKTLGAGAVSAAAGGAAEAGRAASAAKEKVTGKLASAKERIKGLVKSGRKAVAGGLRAAAAKVEPKETAKKSTPVGTSANPRVGQPGKERPALPAAKSGKTTTSSNSRRTAAALKLAKAAAGSGPSGETQQGQPAGTFKSKKSREQARKREARLTAAESLNLLDLVVADLIKEGYANDIDHAYDLIENMDSEQTYNLVESYIEEETVDVYDIVLEHLVVEGYADTLEQAEAIMVNMSEQWRNEIIDEGYKKLPVGRMMGRVQTLAFRRGAAKDDNTPENARSHERAANMTVTADRHDPKKSKDKEYENRVRGAAKKVYGN